MANITNEVLAEKIEGISLRLAGMEKKIDAMPSAFVSHEVLELKLAPISERLADVENRKSVMAWGIPILVAVTSSILTFLIVERLK